MAGFLEPENDLRAPNRCEVCGARMIYKGMGEYRCDKCRHIMYDDYGLVHNYLTENPGASIQKVADETGVPDTTIERLLRQERLEVAENSKMFLRCEKCGAPIRLGRLCVVCEKAQNDKNRQEQWDSRMQQRRQLIQGLAGSMDGSSGKKRFNR